MHCPLVFKDFQCKITLLPNFTYFGCGVKADCRSLDEDEDEVPRVISLVIVDKELDDRRESVKQLKL
jgi:hypothetical protein